MNLVIYKCPKHPAFWAVAIEDGNSAERITPNKCCGSWSIVHKWEIDKPMAKDAIRLFKEATP